MKILASDYDGTLRVNEKVESYDLDMIHKHRWYRLKKLYDYDER